MTEDELKAIEGRHAKARVPGTIQSSGRMASDYDRNWQCEDGDGVAWEFTTADRAYLPRVLFMGSDAVHRAYAYADAQRDIPALVAEVRRLRAKLTPPRRVLLDPECDPGRGYVVQLSIFGELYAYAVRSLENVEFNEDFEKFFQQVEDLSGQRWAIKDGEPLPHVVPDHWVGKGVVPAIDAYDERFRQLEEHLKLTAEVERLRTENHWLTQQLKKHGVPLYDAVVNLAGEEE